MKKRQLEPAVLFEDDTIIAFDKPSGLLVAPDRFDKTKPSLMDWVHRTLSPTIFNVHRLDRETSGLVLCAKTRDALRTLCRSFEGREVEKRYIALVRGAPAWDEKRVDLSLAPDLASPGRMRVDRAGKPASTQFRVLTRWRRYAQVEAAPLSGRTHQIRVHLASLGCPIVSDRFYGGGRHFYLSEIKRDYKQKPDRQEIPMMGRLALHAASLAFRHPGTGAAVTIRAPLPHDFEVAFRYLDRFAAATGAPDQNSGTAR